MRLALLSKSLKFAFDLLRIIRPVRDDLSVVVVTDDEQLVAIVNLIREFERRGLELFDVRANRQRVIHQQNDARRREIRRKILYRLLDAIVKQ